MARIWEKAISILAGNINSGHTYLITAVCKSLFYIIDSSSNVVLAFWKWWPLCCFCGLGNWKQTSQSGHYCYSGLLIIAQRVSRKCLANDPFLVWYPHNKLHLHIIYKVCLIYSVSNQFAFLSHYRYVFVTPCVSWVVSSSVSLCRKQRSKVPQWILKIIFSSKSRIDIKLITCLNRRFCI